MFKDFGSRMKSRREQLDWSLRRLGNECNVSASFLSDIENNKSFPSMEKAAEIASALKVSLSWLLGESESDDADVLINKIKEGGIEYELFLDKHVFPNGLTYEQMCAKIKSLEKIQNILTTNKADDKEDKKNK